MISLLILHQRVSRISKVGILRYAIPMALDSLTSRARSLSVAWPAIFVRLRFGIVQTPSGLSKSLLLSAASMRLASNVDYCTGCAAGSPTSTTSQTTSGVRRFTRVMSSYLLPNDAMHPDSASTLGFHSGDQYRGAGDGERYA